MSAKYAVVSLPLGAFDSSDREDGLSSLRATVSSDQGTVVPFKIPDFKIGTLDGLVQEADDLAKLEASCEAVVAKVADSLRSVLDNDPDRLASYKMVNDSEHYAEMTGKLLDKETNGCLQNRPITTLATLAGTRFATDPTSPSANSLIPFKRFAAL